MRYHPLNVATVALFALVAAPPWARGDAPACGYVVSGLCPICTPQTPTGGCYCGPHEGACWCRKTSGGVQEGIMILCGPPDDFNWTYDSKGLKITEGPQRLCLTAYKCMLPGGSQGNCGAYIAGTCIPYGEATCGWRVFGDPVTQPTWEAGSVCGSSP